MIQSEFNERLYEILRRRGPHYMRALGRPGIVGTLSQDNTVIYDAITFLYAEVLEDSKIALETQRD